MKMKEFGPIKFQRRHLIFFTITAVHSHQRISVTCVFLYHCLDSVQQYREMKKLTSS